PNLSVRLVSTPLLPLLYHCDTMPSSASSFRTSLLVYHLSSLSPNVCRLLPTPLFCSPFCLKFHCLLVILFPLVMYQNALFAKRVLSHLEKLQLCFPTEGVNNRGRQLLQSPRPFTG